MDDVTYHLNLIFHPQKKSQFFAVLSSIHLSSSRRLCHYLTHLLIESHYKTSIFELAIDHFITIEIDTIKIVFEVDDKSALLHHVSICVSCS